MDYFSTRNTILFLPAPLIDDKVQELNKFLKILDNSGVSELLHNDRNSYGDLGGRPSFNKYFLFATIVYAFSLGYRSLRDIETAIKYDLRCMYLMNYEIPTYKTIANFINKFILPNADQIFTIITKEIIKTMDVDISDVFIDGSKFEADANKYKFVWKPTTYHIKLSNKIRELLRKYEIEKDLPSIGILPSKIIADKLTELCNLSTQSKQKELEQDCSTLSSLLLKALEYEEKETICGETRKSFYKTDNDATAMALKADYYSGKGSNMHAAYNVQIGLSNGLIISYLITQSRNDINDFIRFLDKFHQYYNIYPKNMRRCRIWII